MKMTSINIRRICLVAMAVAVNVVGGQIALLLRLPVYLDSVGTILVGALLGPLYGMLPNLLSGICLGLTTDIYSLYFAPAGMAIGLMAGLVFEKMAVKGWRIFPAALLVA
ncbi:MAG TPA: ECF transporter S component, partial [Lachnospiraceae bacterium]|nr:ECF transporter S component [Lachnospiraceae bacterium]